MWYRGGRSPTPLLHSPDTLQHLSARLVQHASLVLNHIQTQYLSQLLSAGSCPPRLRDQLRTGYPKVSDQIWLRIRNDDFRIDRLDTMREEWRVEGDGLILPAFASGVRAIYPVLSISSTTKLM